MPRPAKNKLFLTTALVLAVAGGMFAIQTMNAGPVLGQMGDAAPAMPVPAVTVTEEKIQIWKEFSARLSAIDFVEIRPQVSGLIEKIHFEDGAIVKKGDELFTIDQRRYQAASAQAKADLNAAYSDNTYAKKELERAEELIKTGALSRQIYDQRVNAVKSAQSQIAAAQAAVQTAQVDLDNSRILAPISGRISRAEITAGNLVDAASAPLMTTIVSESDVYADFDIDETTYLKYIRSGDDTQKSAPVRMQLAGDERWYEGTIQSFDNRINPSSGTIRARAIFANADGALLPGMFTRVQIGSTGEQSGITVTERAIGTDQNRKFVYVVENGVATYRGVTLGDSAGGRRVVLSGLKIGETVIIDGLMKLRPGAKVQPMTPEQMEAMKAQMAGGGAQAPEQETAIQPQEETGVTPDIDLPSMNEPEVDTGAGTLLRVAPESNGNSQ